MKMHYYLASARRSYYCKYYSYYCYLPITTFIFFVCFSLLSVIAWQPSSSSSRSSSSTPHTHADADAITTTTRTTTTTTRTRTDITNMNTTTAPTARRRHDYPPGALRRRWLEDANILMPPKIRLPLPLMSAIVASLKESNPIKAVSIFFQTLWAAAQEEEQQQQQHSASLLLPISHRPFSELHFVESGDCLRLQDQQRRTKLPSFLLELTMPDCCNAATHDDDDDDDDDYRQCQIQWLQENAELVKDWKIKHGAVYFRSWSIFRDASGVNQAWKALGMTPCRDPKEIRGPTPLLKGSSTLYETLNNPADAQTHLGLHYEGIPGIMPMSALFSCFHEATQGGGEFLVCDGRRVFRDLNQETLARLETKKLQPTFAEIPPWMSGMTTGNPIIPEILALLTDMTKPTDDFFLDVFPVDQEKDSNNNNKHHHSRQQQQQETLKLTTHPTVPVLYHPVTGQPVWFSGMDAGEKRNFQRDNPHLAGASNDHRDTDNNDNNNNNNGGGGGKYASETFDVRYGDDGTEITETDLNNVRQACQKNTIEIAMKPGDAVFLDNFSTLHGRKPFVGSRRHTVVWFLD